MDQPRAWKSLAALATLLLLSAYTAHAQSPQGGARPLRPNRPERAGVRGTAPRREAGRHRVPDRVPASLDRARIEIAVGAEEGVVRPLLGVNAGPCPAGEPGNPDLVDAYREVGVTAVRTHDLYGPFDLSVMYPSIAADPADPASYDFRASDAAFSLIRKAGLGLYLRIGDSYNNVRVPSDDRQRANLVRAAVEVVRHYRHGGMNGFSAPIRYVEIGNEPDNRRFWPPGFRDFLPFFAETFAALKTQFPDLRVGGPGFVVATYKIPAARTNVGMFLDYARSRGAVPDFVSFHLYSNDPAEYFDIVQFYRNALLRAGMSAAELHITEWNTEEGDHPKRLGLEAAPYVSAAWIALQMAGAETSFIYRGNDTSIQHPAFYGIFLADGTPKPAAKALGLWSQLAHFPDRLTIRTGVPLLDEIPRLTGDLKPLWILAGRSNSGEVALLLSNIGTQRIDYTLTLPVAMESAQVTEIRPPEAAVVTFAATGPLLAISPMTVQLVKVSPKK